MPRLKRNFRICYYYHLYNRGNRKSIVFYDSADYQFFLDNIYYYANKYSVNILAHCLMPNHYHLVVQCNDHAENISSMMQSAMTRFCVYINKRYDLVGRTFQGTYKHKLLETEYDLLRLKKYLRENPIKAGMVTKSEYYRWLRT